MRLFRLLAIIQAVIFLGLFVINKAIAQPMCSSAFSDTDGDGWGWENDQSCIVVPDVSMPIPGLETDDINRSKCGADAIALVARIRGGALTPAQVQQLIADIAALPFTCMSCQ